MKPMGDACGLWRLRAQRSTKTCHGARAKILLCPPQRAKPGNGVTFLCGSSMMVIMYEYSMYIYIMYTYILMCRHMYIINIYVYAIYICTYTHLHMYIYIYIHVNMNMCITSFSLLLSLSLYIYIYIYMYSTYILSVAPATIYLSQFMDANLLFLHNLSLRSCGHCKGKEYGTRRELPKSSFNILQSALFQRVSWQSWKLGVDLEISTSS